MKQYIYIAIFIISEDIHSSTLNAIKRLEEELKGEKNSIKFKTSSLLCLLKENQFLGQKWNNNYKEFSGTYERKHGSQ